ncbi:MAG: hypothetical protein K0Q67_1578 [Cellvibrio sp.]|jgi:hypothetical protein|nr:hypothetical protein [Cellvibrio sp.]
MYQLLFIASVVLWILSPWAQAHEGHEHMPVSIKKAVEIALATTRAYTLAPPPFDLSQLDQSWRELPASAAQIHENGRGYYVVRVENPARAKTLYLRILLNGNIDGANFSGDFVSSAATSSAN